MRIFCRKKIVREEPLVVTKKKKKVMVEKKVDLKTPVNADEWIDDPDNWDVHDCPYKTKRAAEG